MCTCSPWQGANPSFPAITRNETIMGRYNFLEEIYKIPDSNSGISVVDFTAKCSPEQDKGGKRLLSLLDIHTCYSVLCPVLSSRIVIFSHYV